MSELSYDDIDLSKISNEAAFGFDPAILAGIDSGEIDYNQLFDQQGLSDVLASLGGENGSDLLGEVDYNQLFDQQGLSDILGDVGEADLSQLLSVPGALGISDDAANSLIGDAGEVDVNAPLLTPGGIDESFTDRLNDFDYKRYIDYLSPEGQAGAEKYQEVLDKLDSGPANDTVARGEVGPWQQSGSDRIMINEDGTGIGVNENGEMYTLSKSEVNQMVKNNQLNTYESGYNTLAGGNKIAPGGGSSVVLKNGKEGQLMPNGNVIDTNTGQTIGTQKDVKTVVTQDSDGNKITKDPEKLTDDKKTDIKKTDTGTKTTTTTGTKTGTQQNSLSSILPLLLMMLAMNKDKGGGGQSTVIPALTALQKQTPYTQQQKAAGYRPGQGGINYFEPTQYVPKMAAGGGISRLLQGPGDGVSDSIPAVIDGGMAGGGQPAKVARGEYIIDARTVAALGNGSTDAGAERLDKMRKDILRDDRKAGVGQDSKAYRHLMA